MADNYRLGMQCKAYLGDTLLTGTYAGSGITWTEAGNLTDVTINMETGESDITTRSNNGWRATAPTLKNGTVEFEMVWLPGDTLFDALQDAWENATEESMAFIDGSITAHADNAGNSGIVANFVVTNFTRTEPLEEAVKARVTLKPSSYTTWWTVPAS